MPITAMLDDGTRVKARSYPEDEWRSMVGSRHRPTFLCTFCEAPMYLKTISSTGLQCFAHYAGGPDCSFHVGGKESGLHLQLKDYITRAIDNTTGWEGWPERRVEVGDRHYVADVYATRIDGKPAKPGVFEVQLTRKPDAEIIDRGAIRDASGAVTTWLTRTEVPWFRRLPTLRFDVNDSGRVKVIDGLMKTDEEKAPPILLEKFISKRLADRYTFVENIGIIGKGDWQHRPAPSPVARLSASLGGSDDCSRPSERRPKFTSPRYLDTLRTAPAGEPQPERVSTQCGHVGCRQPAQVVLVFRSAAAGKASMCAEHAEIIPAHLVTDRQAVPA